MASLVAPTPAAAAPPRVAATTRAVTPVKPWATQAQAAQPRSGAAALAVLVAMAGAAAARGFGSRRRRRRGHIGNTRQNASGVALHAYVMGPGWTDELARIFDPRPEGPDWQPELGYRGRPRLRLLIDGEDLAHSYADALYKLTGKWTGPLSAGIEAAFLYGSWRGGEGPDTETGRDDVNMASPEIMTFLAMPADLIEAVQPWHCVDGYPESLRAEEQRCLFGEAGYFINEWIRSLQDERRLITWNRPARLPGGASRQTALQEQKYYQPGKCVALRALKAMPIMLSQVIGSGTSLKTGDKVEALKSGRLVDSRWSPSEWKKARVIAVNYDGTYDLQFEMNFGPFRENKKTGLNGLPQLSLKPNEVYMDFGADTMPAKFRLMQEMNYAPATPPSQIRLPGLMDRISDTMDTEGNQDWYLCTSKDFVLTASARVLDLDRLSEFKRKFKFEFRWVEDGLGGLRFEPVPNASMAAALRSSHGETASQFAMSSLADEEQRKKLDQYKTELASLTETMTNVPEAPPARPSRPAGPRSWTEKALEEAASSRF